MLNRTSVPAIVGTLVLGLSVLVAAHEPENTLHTNYLTFSGPVALPGVTLGAGTYIFERAVPTNADIVVVRDEGRSKVYFLGFTDRADRPAGMRDDQAVIIGEARRGSPPPITAWYPVGEPRGHRFIYETR